ncbi:hypothetical protein [Dactylosporangium sp. CA-233914]|uniref:hypothetical protein n=1 Tax=Dactylosporangium sp. CA-233914 TaxID=3239934 RepID=UPI003D9379F8
MTTPTPPRPSGPRTGVLLAIVGGLLALCCAGGAAAAYVVEKGLPDVLPTNLSHRQPQDPCELLGKDAFGTDFGGVLTGSEKGDRGVCDYMFQRDPRGPAQPNRLRLLVDVSAQAGTEFDAARNSPSRLPVECGQRAYATHTIDPAGENAEATLWCVDRDVYLMLTFRGYDHDRFSGLPLDETMAALGRTALSNVPKA